MRYCLKSLPWGSLVMIGGMGMLVALAKSVGALDILANAVSGVPTALLAATFVVLSGVISLFASSLSVVFPTMIPIAAIAVKTGLNPSILFSAIACGTLTAAISPLSTGGSLVYSACTPEINDLQKQFYGQFAGAMILLVCVGILGFCGLTNLFHF